MLFLGLKFTTWWESFTTTMYFCNKGTYFISCAIFISRYTSTSHSFRKLTNVAFSYQGMVLMAAMGLPGGGRNQISDRLLSRFNVINMTFPSEIQIGRIFGTLLKQHMADFEEEVRMTGKHNKTCGLETRFIICYLLHSHGSHGFYKHLEADISKLHLHSMVLKSLHIVASYIYMKNVL